MDDGGNLDPTSGAADVNAPSPSSLIPGYAQNSWIGALAVSAPGTRLNSQCLEYHDKWYPVVSGPTRHPLHRAQVHALTAPAYDCRGAENNYLEHDPSQMLNAGREYYSRCIREIRRVIRWQAGTLAGIRGENDGEIRE